MDVGPGNIKIWAVTTPVWPLDEMLNTDCTDGLC